MTLSSAINNAASGLTAVARQAQVTSNNVSNAQTDGYGRREVNLVSGQLGGVRVESVSRITDRTVIADRRIADADVGRQQTSANALLRLEQTFGPVGDPNGIAGRYAALEQSLISAGSEPSSDLRLQSVVSRLGDLTNAIRSDADALKAQREVADAAIASDIGTLNKSIKQVEDLNADISRMISSGHDPAAVIDARQLVIDKIADIVPLKEIDRGNGQVALYTKSGAGLIDGKAATFDFNPTSTIMPAMSFAGGVLSGISQNGTPLDVGNGFGRLDGGTLGANFVLRDQTIPDIQAGLDNIAADLLRRFEDPAVDPTQVAGASGLLTDGGAPLDPLDITGLSFRLEINAVVDPARGGDVTGLRDGLAAAASGPVGSAAQLDRWLSALRATSSLTPGGATRSVAGHMADHIANVGQKRLNAEESLSFEVARQTTLRTAELAGGVDSDQEMQNLIRIEQAYAANARVMQTLDAMIRRLMEI